MRSNHVIIIAHTIRHSILSASLFKRHAIEPFDNIKVFDFFDGQATSPGCT
jgi:hypothetical protein